MFMWFSVTAVTEAYQWSGWTSSSFVIDIFFVCKMFYNFNIAFDYLLMLTIFHVENVLIILDWCLCDFLLLKHIDEVDGLPSSFVIDIFFVWKIFYDFNTAFDYLLMLTIFHVENVLIILDWCLCDFLLLKHINKVHALHVICHLLMLTYFLCGKYSRISILVLIIYWCWLFFMCKMFLSFSTDVYVSFCYWNISMKCTHFILICHLLMLTFFYVQNVLIILNWCLCDFLVLKHIDEVDALHPHLSYTASDYLLMLIIFHVENVLIILDWCLCDFLLLKYIDEVDGLHLHLSLTDVDIFFVWKIFYDFNTAFDYLLMLTYFSCAKCSYHSWLMFMWFSCTETYQWSVHTSSSFVIDWCWHFLCGKYSRISIVFLIIYWCWLFFMCKMLSFSTDVYVIFLYWNISMEFSLRKVSLREPPGGQILINYAC